MTHPPSDTPTWLAPGTRLNDLYEIDASLSAGGMGEIYRGHAILTGDPVAIKTIRADVAEMDTALTLFRREAAALHNLNHEAIVRYYVFSVDPALQRPYLAMEYVSGPSLARMISNAPLAPGQVRVLGARIASGLQAAHERGIIHRDISPDNIIVPEGDVALAKIIDFGIARQTRDRDGTIIGDGFAGKYNYVSPEQLGLQGGDVGAASDIYSLGLVLAEAVIGQALDMRGSPAQIIEKRRGVPDLSRVDPLLRPLIERMLQPDPRARPGSMTEVAAWLRRAGTHGPSARAAASAPTLVSARPGRPAGPRAAEGRGSARRWPVVAGAAVACAALAGLAVFVLRDTPVPPPVPAPPAPVAPQAAPVGPDAAITLTQITPASRMGATAAEISAFLERWPGADCTVLAPVLVADNRAAGEGFARSPEAFSGMLSDFRQALGLSLELRLNEVTPAQCPLVGFLADTRAGGMAPPALELVSFRPGPGEMLAGEAFVERPGYVGVVAVFTDGTVRVASPSLQPEQEGQRFELELDPRLAPAGSPVLVVAIGSSAPLALLRPDATFTAAAFVSQIRARADAAGLKMAASAALVTVR